MAKARGKAIKRTLTNGHAKKLDQRHDAEFNDQQILERVKAGEHEAFTELYNRHEQVARRLAHRVLGHDTDADDAVQVGFINAYRGLHRFQGRSCFKTWLLRIVSNAALTLLRQQRRAAKAEASARRPTETEPRRPLETLLADELSQLIARLLEQYAPLRMRRVWKLHIEQEMTFPEIAGKTKGMNAETVRNIMRKVRAMLRQHLAELDKSVH